MKIKTAELAGLALDWAVAVCEGYDDWDDEDPEYLGFGRKDGHIVFEGILDLPYSSNWAQSGPIIERELIGVAPSTQHEKWWVAGTIYENEFFKQEGHTPLIAAMRCYVASELGDEVDVPDELI